MAISRLGMAMAARMPMIATTMSNSIRVNPRSLCIRGSAFPGCDESSGGCERIARAGRVNRAGLLRLHALGIHREGAVLEDDVAVELRRRAVDIGVVGLVLAVRLDRVVVRGRLGVVLRA